MAFREVTMLEVRELLRLWLLGVAKKQVATQLGFDVKTVRRYLAAAKARGVEQSHGLAALDDDLVAAVLAATQPAAGPPRGAGWGGRRLARIASPGCWPPGSRRPVGRAARAGRCVRRTVSSSPGTSRT